MTDNRKGGEMLNDNSDSKTLKRWLAVTAVAVCVGVTIGCGCPKAHQAIAFVEVDGQFFSFPDTNRIGDPVPNVRAGEIVSFVNTTGKTCTVTADAGAFTGDNIVTVKPHNCTKVTIANLSAGATISNIINCEGDDHGAPQMIVQAGPPQNPD